MTPKVISLLATLTFGAILVVTLGGLESTYRDRGPTLEIEPGKTLPYEVNLNTATAADLEVLPSIGPRRARAIIDLRRQKGRFQEIEELMEIRGIGPKTVDRLRPLIRL